MTGGYGDWPTRTDTTELYQGNKWRVLTAKLPFAIPGMQVLQFNNKILSFGNYFCFKLLIDLFCFLSIIFATPNKILQLTPLFNFLICHLGGSKVLEFNKETNDWTEIGPFLEAQNHHAASVVRIDDFKAWCRK